MKIIDAGTRLTCTTVYQFGTIAMEGPISWGRRRRSFTLLRGAYCTVGCSKCSYQFPYCILHCIVVYFDLSLHFLYGSVICFISDYCTFDLSWWKGVNNHRNPCILCSLVSKTNGRNLLRGPLKLVLVALSHQSWKKGRLWRWLLMSSRQWQLWMILLKRKAKVLFWIISYSYE